MTNSPEKNPQIPREKPNPLEKLVSTLMANLEQLTQKVRGKQAENLRKMFKKIPINEQIRVFLTIKEIADFINTNRDCLKKEENDAKYQNYQIKIIKQITNLYYNLFIVNSFGADVRSFDYKMIGSLDLGEFEDIIMTAITKS